MNDIILALSTVSAGTVLKWIVIVGTSIGAIIGVAIGITIKVYKLHEQLRQYENKKDELEDFIKQTKDDISELKNRYVELAEFVKQTKEESNKIDQIKLRHSIVRACEEAISNGYITLEALKAIDELYEVYHGILNGNSYAEDLVKIVHTLPVRKRDVQ